MERYLKDFPPKSTPDRDDILMVYRIAAQNQEFQRYLEDNRRTAIEAAQSTGFSFRRLLGLK